MPAVRHGLAAVRRYHEPRPRRAARRRAARRARLHSREQHFYFYASDSWWQGMRHYKEHFADCPPSGSADFHFSVDATPAYVRHPAVATRPPEVLPREALPRLRFIVMLRDPAERLYAYWDAFVLPGVGVHDFDAWLGPVLARGRACQHRHGDQLWPPPSDCNADTLSGLAAGLYAYQLIHWLHQFEPSQFLITSLQAYEDDPKAVVADCAAHLGAPRALSDAMREPSDPTQVKAMGGMTAWARRELGEFYRPHNAQLLHLLNSQQPAPRAVQPLRQGPRSTQHWV